VKPRTRRAAALAAWLLAALALQEAVLRVVFPLPELASFNRVDYMRLASPADRHPLRSLKLVWESEPDAARFVHRLNAYGFRDREWRLAKRPGVPRVFFVGDSFVEGTMAADDETIPRAFEAAAAREGLRVEAMNLGVMGADLGHAFQLVHDAAPLFAPDAVILVIFANDLPTSGIAVASRAAERFDARVPRLASVARLLAAGEMPPLAWPLREVRYHVPASDPRQPWHGREAEVRARVRPDVAEAVLAGRFNPYRVGGAGYLVEPLRMPIAMEEPLRFLSRTAARAGARLFVAYLPDRTQVTRRYAPFEAALGAPGVDLSAAGFQAHRRALVRDCRAAGVPFLDLLPLLRRADASAGPLWWDYDDHMRAEGYRLVGEALFAWWSRARGGAPGP
jgi:lysophospholipase L1-like esterase